MKLNKKMIIRIAIFALIFIFTTSLNHGGAVDAVSQTEIEDQLNRAISVLSEDSEIIRDILYDRANSNQSENFINEYLQSSELVDLRISEDGFVDIVNDNEIEINTYLIVELDPEDSNIREVEMDITVMLRKIDKNWTIDSWELGHRDRDDRQPGNQYRHEVDRVLNDIFTAILSGNTSNLYNYLDSDFEYEGPALDGGRREVELDRREFISILDEIFADGKSFTTLKLKDISYDIDDDEVEIEGVLIMIGRNSGGHRFINVEYYAELKFEKKNGDWYLEEWEED